LLLGAPPCIGRLVRNMANLRQDRVPGPTLSRPSAPASEGPAVNGHGAATGGVALSLLLRAVDSSGANPAVSFNADSPSAVLVIDVIAASGGAPDVPHGATITARFPHLQSALLAARRLQWALEGLAESSRSSAAASMAIHSVEDGLIDSAASALDAASPAQVLLSERLAPAVQHLPGLALRPSTGGSWRQLEWHSPSEPASFAADEQSVLELMRTLGREDPLAVPDVPPAPAVTASTASHRPDTGLGRTISEPEEIQTPLWKKPWLLVSAGAVVLAIIAVLIIRGMSPAPNSQAAPPDSSSKTPAASSSTAPTVVEKPSASKPPAAKPTAKPVKQGRTEPQTPPKTETEAETPKLPAPPPPAGSCNLNEAEIPLSLQRAARLMSAGKLPEAQDAYQRLVGCPSAREKAAEGLRLVKQRMGFQGSSN
jgi:hypothetical protein